MYAKYYRSLRKWQSKNALVQNCALIFVLKFFCPQRDIKLPNSCFFLHTVACVADFVCGRSFFFEHSAEIFASQSVFVWCNEKLGYNGAGGGWCLAVSSTSAQQTRVGVRPCCSNTTHPSCISYAARRSRRRRSDGSIACSISELTYTIDPPTAKFRFASRQLV